MRFRDYLESDIDDVFLNEDEFAEGHNLNGTVAKAVIQSPTARESFLSNGSHVSNDGLHGVSVFVHCKLKDILEIPSTPPLASALSSIDTSPSSSVAL